MIIVIVYRGYIWEIWVLINVILFVIKDGIEIVRENFISVKKLCMCYGNCFKLVMVLKDILELMCINIM